MRKRMSKPAATSHRHGQTSPRSGFAKGKGDEAAGAASTRDLKREGEEVLHAVSNAIGAGRLHLFALRHARSEEARRAAFDALEATSALSVAGLERLKALLAMVDVQQPPTGLAARAARAPAAVTRAATPPRPPGARQPRPARRPRPKRARSRPGS